MRCGCPECGAYMAQSEGPQLGCVCPQCGFRCKMCLGTNTVVDRDALRAHAQEYLSQAEKDAREDDEP